MRNRLPKIGGHADIASKFVTAFDGAKTYTIYNTEIFRFWPSERRVRLYHGGHIPATTRRHMQKALDFWKIPATVSFARGVPTVRILMGGETLVVTSEFSRYGVVYFSF